MGQKTHPVGFRLGIVKDWDSHLVRRRSTRGLAERGPHVREVHQARLFEAGVATIKIERFGRRSSSSSHRRPGMVIGRKGQQSDLLRAELQKMIGKARPAQHRRR